MAKEEEDEVVVSGWRQTKGSRSSHQSGLPPRGAAAAATFTYRITGHVAHARIEPLLRAAAAADKKDGGCRWVPYHAQNHPQNADNHKNDDGFSSSSSSTNTSRLSLGKRAAPRNQNVARRGLLLLALAQRREHSRQQVGPRSTAGWW